jgi:hypothetical protein
MVECCHADRHLFYDEFHTLAPYSDCHYANCHSAECCGTVYSHGIVTALVEFFIIGM